MLILELFQIKFIITNWINLRISGEVMLIELTLVRATGKISYVYTDVLKMNINRKLRQMFNASLSSELILKIPVWCGSNPY